TMVDVTHGAYVDVRLVALESFGHWFSLISYLTYSLHKNAVHIGPYNDSGLRGSCKGFAGVKNQCNRPRYMISRCTGRQEFARLRVGRKHQSTYESEAIAVATVQLAGWPAGEAGELVMRIAQLRLDALRAGADFPEQCEYSGCVQRLGELVPGQEFGRGM